MVTPTHRPDILLVTFECTPGGQTTGNTPVEISSYVRVSESGLKIYYSHHTIYSRESTVSESYRGAVTRYPLSSQLSALVSSGVMMELWRNLPKDITVFPADPGMSLKAIEEEL